MKIDSKHVNWASLTVCIATIFFFFLIFPQFAFIHRLQSLGFNDSQMQMTLGFMGGSGIICSPIPLSLKRLNGLRIIMIGAWLLGGIATIFAIFSSAPNTLILAAILSGAAIGILTVSLIGLFSIVLTHKEQLGWLCGIGTGIAYALANIPAIFFALPKTQCAIAGLALLPGIIALMSLQLRKYEKPKPIMANRQQPIASPNTFIYWIVALFFAIALDSTAFTMIQKDTDLFALSWGSPGKVWFNGFIHFISALFGGWLLMRKQLYLCWSLACMCLIAGYVLLQTNFEFATFATSIYVIGVSLYSTLLVAVAVLHNPRLKIKQILLRAGMLYSISGWIGSGIGVALGLRYSAIPVGKVFVLLLVFSIFLAIIHNRENQQ